MPFPMNTSIKSIKLFSSRRNSIAKIIECNYIKSILNWKPFFIFNDSFTQNGNIFWFIYWNWFKSNQSGFIDVFETVLFQFHQNCTNFNCECYDSPQFWDMGSIILFLLVNTYHRFWDIFFLFILFNWMWKPMRRE